MLIRRQSGFTIVELLIVIVVIAILAAITIVSYNGITKRSTIAFLQGNLSSAAKILQNDRTLDAGANYPATLLLANGGLGIRASSGAMYQYTVDNTVVPQVYCLTASVGSVGYYIDQSGAIQSGYCSGQVAPIDNTAIVTTLAGSSNGYADGAATSAQFNKPYSIAVASDKTVYVADTSNNRIRKVTPGGVVSVFAGSGVVGNADGTGVAAQFSAPWGIAIDSSGVLYVTDQSNHRIRKITSAGVVTTLAGSTNGFADGTGVSTQFSFPQGITVDTSGIVYVADAANNRIRKITTAGVVTTFAGSTNGYVDATGTSAQFFHPRGLTIDASGTIYVVDSDNNRIRKVTSAGVVTTIAGSTAGYVDATGAAAQFNNPRAIAVAPDGTLYVSDASNNRIRKITTAGVVTSLAGSSLGFADGTGTDALFMHPQGVAIDSAGVIYVADVDNERIRKIQIP